MKKKLKDVKDIVEIEETPSEIKIKIPKYELLSYTVRATIPTGMYANIIPEITIKAATLEIAERAVMPHIEALFAKYREGVPVNVNVPIRPVVKPVAPAPVITEVKQAISQSVEVPKVETVVTTASAEPAIVLTVPFTRAKTAIESCASLGALALIEEQVRVSPKLIDSEKQLLAPEILKKRKTFNG
jgi:hypothetical protein